MKPTLEGSAQILQAAACESPLIWVVLPTFNGAWPATRKHPMEKRTGP